MERVFIYLLEQPGRVKGIGRAMVRICSALLVAAAIGNFVTKAMGILPTLAKRPEVTKRLSEVYPSLPLWWVPESAAGVLAAILGVAAGFVVVNIGRRIDSQLR